MSEVQGLPQGWINTKLEEVCTIIMGQSPPSSAYNEKGIGLPFFQGKTDFTDLYPKARVWCTEPTKIAEKNDILLSVRAPVGPTNLAPSQCSIGRGLAAIRPYDGIEIKYILYIIRTFKQSLIDKSTGTTFNAVSGDIVRSFLLPLAPLPEQQRIVEALEQQLSRLDAGVAALRNAQKKLKRYRASVLKAAVEGKLTKEWRKTHPEVEPAPELLKRILQERRAKWEEEQRAKGRDPQKVKYDEPAEPDVKGLSELPEGWCWATVEQLASIKRNALAIGPFGSDLKVEDYQQEGIPLVFVKNIRSNIFNTSDTKYISLAKAEKLQSHRVVGGDILITKMGDPPGDACLYPQNLSHAIITADCIKWTIHAFLHQKQYFVHIINSHTVKKQILEITKGVAQQKVSLGRFVKISVPLTSLAEQEQIVSLIEERLSIVSTLESTIEQVLKRAERMRQSILHRAFTGKLVAQDPNDEPASVLLERIRRERALAEVPQKVKRPIQKERLRSTGRRVAEHTQSYLPLDISDPEPVDTKVTTQGGLWENDAL